MVITPDSESGNPSSNLGSVSLIIFLFAIELEPGRICCLLVMSQSMSCVAVRQAQVVNWTSTKLTARSLTICMDARMTE